MKMKLNLNGSGLKQSLLAHGEKALFGLAFIGLMLFAYGALKREKLADNFAPEKMRDKVEAAKRTIETAKLGELPADPKLKLDPIVVEPGVIKKFVIDDTLAPQNTLRDDPQVFAIEELRAGSGRGIYSAAAPVRGDRRGAVAAQRAPASAAKGRFWAVITGLLPIAKQEAELRRALGDARENANQKADTNALKYTNFYMVERAEVTSESTDNLKWTPVAPPKEAADWKHEEVPEKFVHSTFTMSLPPIETNWDEGVAHVPQIPLRASANEIKEAIGDPQEGKDEAQPRGFDNFENPQPAPEEAEPEKPAADEQSADVRLFRFFDLNVAQGKQYRYRVRIGIHNPNFGFEQRHLNNKESAGKEFLASGWSEPTPVVVIPFSNQVFAGPIDKANKSGDPSGTVMVTDLNEEGGYEAVGTREVTRGTSVVIRDAQYLDPATRTVQTTKTLINTGAVVIDVDGGEQLPAAGKEKLLEPVSVLILNRQGLLEAHNELDDALSYQSKDLKKMAETPRARQREEESSSDEDRGILGGKASTKTNAKQPPRRVRSQND